MFRSFWKLFNEKGAACLNDPWNCHLLQSAKPLLVFTQACTQIHGKSTIIIKSYFWNRATGYSCSPWGLLGARGHHFGDRSSGHQSQKTGIWHTEINEVDGTEQSTYSRSWRDPFRNIKKGNRLYNKMCRLCSSSQMIWEATNSNRKFRPILFLLFFLTIQCLNNVINYPHSNVCNVILPYLDTGLRPNGSEKSPLECNIFRW